MDFTTWENIIGLIISLLGAVGVLIGSIAALYEKHRRTKKIKKEDTEMIIRKSKEILTTANRLKTVIKDNKTKKIKDGW